MFQAIAVFWLLLDVTTKQLVTQTMALRDSIALWDGIFHLTYTRNYGAAFSLLQGQLWVFYLAMVVLLIMVACFWLRERPHHWTVVVGSALVVAGALGNTLDRLTAGSVIDMFDFRLINFAVFNVADIGITLGSVLFVLWFVFLSGQMRLRLPRQLPAQLASKLTTGLAARWATRADQKKAAAKQTQQQVEARPEQLSPQEPSEALPRPNLRDSIENLLQKWESKLDDD
ncbi:MAG: signal peptidase II [Coriobacteriia bacterium]|nr:signal peptidase II [Coriobacteriia bacterium]